MSRFHNITKQEMDEFAKLNGFQLMSVPNTKELVYGRIFIHHNMKFSLRIYSAINPDGESRGNGEDAIRLVLFYMYNKKPTVVGRSQKCLRVKNWAKNISQAIERIFQAEYWMACPNCQNPMTWRKEQKFFGCIGFFDTGCKGK